MDRMRWPGEVQAHVVVGLPGVPLGHPDHSRLELLNYVIGQTYYSGRLGSALVQPGLVYGVKATPHWGKSNAALIIETATATANLERTLRVIRGEISRLGSEGAQEWELREAKGFKLGRMVLYGIGGDSSEKAILEILLDSEYSGLDLYDYPVRSRQLLAVTLKELNHAARRYLRPELLSVAVAGKLPAQE